MRKAGFAVLVLLVSVGAFAEGQRRPPQPLRPFGQPLAPNERGTQNDDAIKRFRGWKVQSEEGKALKEKYLASGDTGSKLFIISIGELLKASEESVQAQVKENQRGGVVQLGHEVIELWALKFEKDYTPAAKRKLMSLLQGKSAEGPAEDLELFYKGLKARLSKALTDEEKAFFLPSPPARRAGRVAGPVG